FPAFLSTMRSPLLVLLLSATASSVYFSLNNGCSYTVNWYEHHIGPDPLSTLAPNTGIQVEYDLDEYKFTNGINGKTSASLWPTFTHDQPIDIYTVDRSAGFDTPMQISPNGANLEYNLGCKNATCFAPNTSKQMVHLRSNQYNIWFCFPY
ncbi:hypothetical protein PENTCL1PPCAC_723, partial [Pristionchus entomophagus]